MPVVHVPPDLGWKILESSVVWLWFMVKTFWWLFILIILSYLIPVFIDRMKKKRKKERVIK